MKLIFLDRDGVINKDPGGWTEHSYITRREDFHFLPGSLEAIRNLTEAGYDIAVISNQAGINKGFYSKSDLREITDFMLEEIEKSGGRIFSVLYCPHQDSDDCDCRKPKTGLFKKAAGAMNAGFGDTYFIGDGVMDVEAGKKIGTNTILVLSGKTNKEDVAGWKVKPDFIKKDLKEAVDWILKREGK